ncbi:SAV_915 family protein [Actinophytocola gossypii]|uniref:SseB protein N-terminal domain-containing protein n=1 Tax=Actinophytocola gossypii TaxID=2812003 RepID=A0ABT2JGR9_9PSEU|nr:SAV_915 family protein [Actinophytocola gossypii]MCT2587070.1 hypothetical protein [Actinophytocola gossypii]
MTNRAGPRPFERRALRPLRELGIDDDTPLFVLTLPEGNVEVRETHRDELVVFAYTRLDWLFACCGGSQPFVRATVRELRTVGTVLDQFVYAAVDLWHPEGERYPEPDWRDFEPLPLIDTTVPDSTLLWVPIRAGSVGTTKAVVEMATGEHGEPLLLVFSSLARLRAELGEGRAAASVRADHLQRMIDDLGARSVVFDPTVPPQKQDFAREATWATATTRRH